MSHIFSSSANSLNVGVRNSSFWKIRVLDFERPHCIYLYMYALHLFECCGSQCIQRLFFSSTDLKVLYNREENISCALRTESLNVDSFLINVFREWTITLQRGALWPWLLMVWGCRREEWNVVCVSTSVYPPIITLQRTEWHLQSCECNAVEFSRFLLSIPAWQMLELWRWE